MSDGSLDRIPRQPSITVRPILATDITHIIDIQRDVYEVRYHESPDSFTAKVNTAASSCFGAWYEGAMAGYLVAMPVSADGAIELDSTDAPAVPLAEADAIYIHDVAVLPKYQGLGVADVMLVHLYETAIRHRIEHFRLVSVQNSREFWESRGFRVEDRAVPKGYGPEAVLMSRR